MRTTIFKLFTAIPILLILYACSDNGNIAVCPEETERVPILLSSGEAITVAAARTDFPNSKQIGITAAKYKSNTDEIDWSGYSDIQNVIATAGNRENDGSYNFSWGTPTPKYWPMEDEELVFIAYSPAASDNSAVSIYNNDLTKLKLTIKNNMPDVLYSSGNRDRTPYKKTDHIPVNHPVDLGGFEHALTQLTLIVQAEESMNPDIRLTDLHVITPEVGATLDLFTGEVKLLDPPTEDMVLEVVKNGSIQFDEKKYTQQVLVLPGEVIRNNTSIYVGFIDKGVETTGQFTMDQFYKDYLGDLKFEQGKSVELTIKVKGLPVAGSDQQISLMGVLSDWKDKGNYEITIE